MRISDWSSDVCSSDLRLAALEQVVQAADDECRHRDLAVVLERRAHAPEVTVVGGARIADQRLQNRRHLEVGDRQSVVEGKSVSVRVDLGGRRIIKKNNKTTQNRNT